MHVPHAVKVASAYLVTVIRVHALTIVPSVMTITVNIAMVPGGTMVIGTHTGGEWCNFMV